MRTLLKTLITIVVLFVVVGFLLPSSAHVERSVTINASPDRIFPLINDLKAFNRWSPWSRKDPNTTYVFSGSESGVGMKVRWHSEQPDVGTGSQEIVASVPDESVRTRLDFGEMGQAVASFVIAPKGDASEVTWSFDTELSWNPIDRWVGLAMDKLLGPDYEAGLMNLKELAESGS